MSERLIKLEQFILSVDWGKIINAMKVDKVDEREILMRLWRYKSAFKLLTAEEEEVSA